MLQFVTGCSQLPPGGFKELHPPFTITHAPTHRRLPTAHTWLDAGFVCFLYIIIIMLLLFYAPGSLCLQEIDSVCKKIIRFSVVLTVGITKPFSIVTYIFTLVLPPSLPPSFALSLLSSHPLHPSFLPFITPLPLTPSLHSFNQLCLPTYDSYEQFQQSFIIAINEGVEEFGLE